MTVNCQNPCRRSKRFMLAVLVLLVPLLLGCGICVPVGLTPPTPSPEPTPGSGNQPEETLVAFMLDYIVRNEIEVMIEIIETENIPPIDNPPPAFMIVWAPPAEERAEDSETWLDVENPIRVWLYAEGNLAEQENGPQAVEDYRQEYIETSPTFPSIFTWGYYEFGILSISEDMQEARVYLSADCGSLCGHGVEFTMSRNEGGTWEIVNDELLWMS